MKNKKKLLAITLSAVMLTQMPLQVIAKTDTSTPPTTPTTEPAEDSDLKEAKAALEKAIESADNTKARPEYAKINSKDTSKSNFESKLTDAKNTKDDKSSTKDAINKATSDLTTASGSVESLILDIKKLELAIENAEKFKNDDKYRYAARNKKSDFDDALKALKELNEDNTIDSTSDIESKISTLNVAKEALDGVKPIETLYIYKTKIENGKFYGKITSDSYSSRYGIRGVSVQLQTYNGTRKDSDTTNSDGEFIISLGNYYSSESPYELVAKKDGYNKNTYRLSDSDWNDSRKLQKQIYPTNLRYYTTYITGNALGYANKRIEAWEGSTFLGSATISDNGSFSINNISKSYNERYVSFYVESGKREVTPTNLYVAGYEVSGRLYNYTNRKVEIYDGSDYIGSAFTDSYGDFKLTLNSYRSMNSRNLKFYVDDKYAYDSSAATISEAYEGTRIVKGTATKNTRVTVYDDKNNKLGTNTSDTNGNFTIYLTRDLKNGEKISVVTEENDRNPKTVTHTVGTARKETYHIAYISGYPDKTFKPNNNVTRAEAAQMFATLLNKGTNFGTTTVTRFNDANNKWYSPAINFISQKGLIGGYPDGSFKPNALMTRAEFAQMISGYVKAGYPGSSSFKDVEKHWANEAIEKLYGNLSVTGYPDGTFKPNNNITRAEAVTILNSVFGRTTTYQSLTNVSESSLTKFTDVSPSFWAYYQILDASNAHTSQKLGTAVSFELWKK